MQTPAVTTKASSLDVSWCPSNLDLSILPLLSVPERLDLLCRTDREVALRAAARYRSSSSSPCEYVYICMCIFPYPTATEGSSMFSGLLA